MLRMRVAMGGHLEDVTLTNRGVWKGGSASTREGLNLFAPPENTPDFPAWEMKAAMKIIERFPFSTIIEIVRQPDGPEVPGRIY